MRDKMETDEGKEIYRWRKITVEPVIGQIKENLGFRQFCLRGLEGAKIEIRIVSIVHNLKKIWKYRGEKKGYSGEMKNFRIYFFEMKVIVGQRPLLSLPRALAREPARRDKKF